MRTSLLHHKLVATSISALTGDSFIVYQVKRYARPLKIVDNGQILMGIRLFSCYKTAGSVNHTCAETLSEYHRAG